METYDRVTLNPKVVYFKPSCVCKSGYVTGRLSLPRTVCYPVLIDKQLTYLLTHEPVTVTRTFNDLLEHSIHN